MHGRGLRPSSSSRPRARRAIALVAAGLAVALSLVATPPAHAVQLAQAAVVNAVPAAGTPNINDGIVYAIAKVGGEIVLGGSFTSASPATDASIVDTQANTMAFNATTYAIDTTGYLPTVNGTVQTVIPGPKPHEVYIGGTFTTVDGRTLRVALLDLRTGAIVAGWNPPTMNSSVNKLVLAAGHLFVGGVFTKVGPADHAGLVALNPRTGAVQRYVNLAFTGHHNYGRKCDPSTATCAFGETGVRSMDVSPNDKKMVVVGNFTSVSGVDRDQVAMLKLGANALALKADWKTKSYTAACFSQAVDSYTRDVAFAPNGRYFVITSTGGLGKNSDGTKGQCDSAARYETGATGKNVHATWVDYTGEDTLWTVAITGTAVYVGGHARWMNNSLGSNVAAPGAVARPGIAALSPVSGLPLAWNPGRNPRGAGCFALLATKQGLWIGSDTDYIGNGTYLRKELAFFPLAGGEKPSGHKTPTAPGTVFLAGATAPDAADPNRLVSREFNGRAVGTEQPQSSGITWSSVRGVFTLDGQVIYGGTDGFLHSMSFDGHTFGSPVTLDPYDDPTWDHVQTGSGQTYQGIPPTFTTELPTVTSMFFSNGRLFYTQAADKRMHWRWFEPDSGVVGADEFTVAGSHNWSDVAGAFYASGRIYYAVDSTGKLRSMRWGAAGHPVAPSKLVNGSKDWASNGLFLMSVKSDPTPIPSAVFTATCNQHARCTFQATKSVDPDGGVTKYAWSFGDHASKPAARARMVTHRYAKHGAYRVRLTASTTAGESATASHHVMITRVQAR